MTKDQLDNLMEYIDAAADDRRQQLQNNPPLVYNITTKKVGNKLNISLTIDDYNQLNYVDNGRVSNKLDVIIPREIKELIEEIADYNTKKPKKV
jgi:methyl coenzyme M reductase subunit C-like uncharacterized protein (methanogenesis marker protein 7)